MLALPSAIAWLGWLGGMLSLLVFAAITLYTSQLLVACYWVNGRRNRTVSFLPRPRFLYGLLPHLPRRSCMHTCAAIGHDPRPAGPGGAAWLSALHMKDAAGCWGVDGTPNLSLYWCCTADVPLMQYMEAVESVFGRRGAITLGWIQVRFQPLQGVVVWCSGVYPMLFSAVLCAPHC